MPAIQADYKSMRHIPSRKCYQLLLEVAEEEFPNVCQILGYPKTGENTYVGIALLNAGQTKNCRSLQKVQKPPIDKSEGEKLRTRAIMLCKEKGFQEFINTKMPSNIGIPSESECAWYIKKWCDIKSRSELATNFVAQYKFKKLIEEYKTWQFENNYADNLDRI